MIIVTTRIIFPARNRIKVAQFIQVLQIWEHVSHGETAKRYASCSHPLCSHPWGSARPLRRY